MDKRAEVNWFVIMAIIALFALLVMLLMSGGVFSKFMHGFGGVALEAELKAECVPGQTDIDSDNDGYKSVGTACIDKVKYICDQDDNDPKKTYKAEGKC